MKRIFALFLVAMLKVLVYVIEIALSEMERRGFSEFGVFELIEGKVKTVFQDALEVVESDGVLSGVRVIFDLDFRVVFLERIEGLGVGIEIGEA